jgi:hypothetical protein
MGASGFDEEWLKQYQKRIAGQREQTRCPVKPSRSRGHTRNDTPVSDAERALLSAEYALRRESGGLPALAKEMGRSRVRIGRLAAEMGLTLPAAPRRPWTNDDDAVLLIKYLQAARVGQLAALAEEMGRTRHFLARKARALGLTDGSAPKPWLLGGKLKGREAEFIECHDSASDKALSARFDVSIAAIRSWRSDLGLKKSRTKKWLHSPHPKGFTGGSHTSEARAAIGEKARAAWKRPGFYTEAHRQQRSDRVSKLHAEGKFRNAYSRGSAGRADDLGDTFYRSSWERNYARYLNFLKGRGDIYHWLFEADTFWFEAIRRGVRSFKPDFKIWSRPDSEPYYVEIKGWMDKKSETKLRRMKKYHPRTRVDLVDQKQYAALAQTVGRLLPNWEHGKSFGRKQRDLLL